MLSAHSFNALLKTLEEPPPHVVFVFATTEVHKIPVTILSRCQRFDFKLISTVRLASTWTASCARRKIKAAPDAVRLIARQAAGSVRDALSLLDQAIAYVAPEPLTAEVTADVLGSRIGGCSSSWREPRWTAMRGRRCAWWRAPPIAGSTSASSDAHSWDSCVTWR
jgi:DNA polymerase III gamma/tau subunit